LEPPPPSGSCAVVCVDDSIAQVLRDAVAKAMSLLRRNERPPF
jgi:hypothetical protein